MSKITFLPKGYEAPKSSNYYMKLQEGDNKIRILTQPILGWEDWLEEGATKKPVRFRFDSKPTKPLNASKPVKHFWAFVVWNYAEEQIQILHVTQATIRNGIESLCNDEDWGAPFFYDIKIIKKGEKIETEYTVNPLPHKPLAKHIIEKFNERPCNLDALYDNEDPFASSSEQRTPGIFSQDNMNFEQVETKGTISADQLQELNAIIEDCDPNFFTKLMDHLKKSSADITRLDDLPAILFDRIKNALTKHRNDYQAIREKNEELEVING